MAGIGFGLRELDASGSVSARVLAAGYAILIGAGPFILASASLVLVGSIVTGSILPADHQSFRVIVIYAFFLGMLGSAAPAVVGARLAADAIYVGETQSVRRFVVGALVVSSLSSALVAFGVFAGLADMPWRLMMLALSLAVVASWLFTSMLFAVALRDYAVIALALLAGVVVIVGPAFVLARGEVRPGDLVVVVVAGVLTSAALLTARLASFFDGHCTSASDVAGEIVAACGRWPMLAIGTLAAAAGVWIDKWVMWGAGHGGTTTLGLRHAPSYDHAMLVSFLAMIPLVAQFAVHMETRLYVGIRRFLSTIMDHGALGAIEASGRDLADAIRRDLVRLLTIQLAISVFVIMLLPGFAVIGLLPFGEVPIARIGLLGAVFHLGLIASSAVLVYLDCRVSLAVLNVGFLVLNGLMTAGCAALDARYTGYGYASAAVIAGVAALLRLDMVLSRLPETMFRRSLAEAWMSAGRRNGSAGTAR